MQVLNKLWKRRSEFDHIVIETTGLAAPGPIISSFYLDPDLPDRVRLDGVVTVVRRVIVIRSTCPICYAAIALLSRHCRNFASSCIVSPNLPPHTRECC